MSFFKVDNFYKLTGVDKKVDDFYRLTGLDKSDFKFFIPFGVIVGMLMQISSFLPPQISNQIFVDLVYDHVPFTSVIVLFTIQILILCFYHNLKNGKTKRYVRGFAFHSSRKLGHFASPATSLFIGLALAATIWTILPSTESQSEYIKIFVWTSLFFFLISVF